MNDALCRLTVAQLAELIRARSISPVELTEAFLARIEACDAQVNAYVAVTAEHARAQARRAQDDIMRGAYRGVLHGIPFAVKDVFETAGIRTTAHSRVLADNVPTRDAAAVRRLYEAGGVLLGKLATHEFAHGGPSFDLPWPPARNPWNAAHYAGGSSSGSAAAVAGALAAYTLGTDTGGSIRSPSWLCGTVGLKPTFGVVSRAGIVPFSSSCDHVGPLAWTVEDCALVLQALAGRDADDPVSVDAQLWNLRSRLATSLQGMRIGVVRHFWEEDVAVDPELAQATEDALDVLRGLGAEVETVRLEPLQRYYAVRLLLTESELFALHRRRLATHADEYGDHFLARCLPACLYTAEDYVTAQRERARIIADMRPVYERYDALVTPGAGPAPALRDHERIGGSDKFLQPGMGTLFSLTGAPALALCCGYSRSGLPLGLQIAGRPYEDDRVLSIGHAYERATGWRARRPELVPGATAPDVPPAAAAREPAPPDPALREHVLTMAARAGLELSPRALRLLLSTAPYALELARRIPRDAPEALPPAALFRV